MLRADYTRSWDRHYKGRERNRIIDEMTRMETFATEQELTEDLFEVKALDDSGTLQRYHRLDEIEAIDEDDIYAVAMEYSDEDNGVRLEYDRNPAIHDEFKLYVQGDDLFRDEVTAAMDAAATPTVTKAIRDLLPDVLD